MQSQATKITEVASIFRTINGTTHWVEDACQRQFSLTPNGDLHYDFEYRDLMGSKIKVKRTYQEIVNTVASWGNT